MASTTELYTTALKHHQVGEIDRAERLYREIIRVDPQHADALHLLGVTAHQRNQYAQAIGHIGRAIELNEAVASYHSNLGAAYRALGQLSSAVESLRNAVRIDPGYAEGHQNLGILLSEQGHSGEADECLKRAQQLKIASGQLPADGKEYIWKGIYRHFDEVPVRGGGHEGYNWAQATAVGNRRLLQSMQTNRTIPLNTTGYHNFLPMLAGLVAQQTGSVRILDFGGATGTAFLHCVGAMADPSGLEFHIVETPSACQVGEQLLGDDARITFHQSIANVPAGIDIVHLNGTLQYIRDYQAVLEELCALDAPYFLLPRLSAGDFPTFATAQMNLWDDIVAYWFVNINELIDIMRKNGYRLLFKGAQELVYDQSNFPAEYRMGRACHLLFGRVGDSRHQTEAA